MRNGGLERLPVVVGFIPNLIFNAEKLVFHSFWNIRLGSLACVHRLVYAYACMKHAHANFGHACTYMCMRTHALGFLDLFFPKIDLFNSWKSYIFPKTLSSSQFQFDRALNQPWALEFQHHWGAGGLSCKEYKMRCLQMPFFWFMSFVNGIKRTRDKTFCFNIWLEPNPCTQHRTHIHGEVCNSTELREIHMFEFPPLLLEKRATTSSLSHYLFCQLQIKGKWLIILESQKMKNKHGQRPQPSTKQIRFSYELKGYIFVVSI